jgi:glucosamine 6-phosphate synthetase-like amidotransferase/phosphosugar isomerase protein
MCGIAGWAMPVGSKWRPDKELISFWLDSIENRGRDASGYFTLTDEETPRRFWMKGPVIASKFSKEWIQRDVTPVGRIGLMHTRSWTVGPPAFNENNHPLVVNKTIVTHNGGFTEYQKVYDELGIEKPVAQVDSACLPHAIDKLGVHAGIDAIMRLTPGLAAFACYTKDGDLVLGKDGRPLYLSHLPEDGIMWSSDPEPLFASQEFDGKLNWDVMRFPLLKYMVFNGKTLDLLETNKFMLQTPKFTNSGHTSGMGFTGTKGATSTKSTTVEHADAKRVICAWGRCTALATKTVCDVDNKQKHVCKPHKKEWVRGVKVPTWDEV